MTTYWLKFILLSDATFGRGDGVAGLVDAEVQHDEAGLPYLGGKTLKGLLGAECAEILFALRQNPARNMDKWESAAAQLFGQPGSGTKETGMMHVGDAYLPKPLRAAVWTEFVSLDDAARGEFRRITLESLTALRRQTAMDAVSGAPLKNSLRTMRVIVRETPFESELTLLNEIQLPQQSLLAACVRAFRRVGSGRNRGRGRVQAEIYDRYPADSIQPVTTRWFAQFQREVQP